MTAEVGSDFFLILAENAVFFRRNARRGGGERGWVGRIEFRVHSEDSQLIKGRRSTHEGVMVPGSLPLRESLIDLPQQPCSRDTLSLISFMGCRGVALRVASSS